MSGQSIVDRLNAAKHTVAGSALGRAVVKATTEEVMGPKRKHLDYLLQCTSEINVSIPQMADLLIERTQNTSWVVTFKSLITIHHLMCYGNERFSQYMASHNSKFILSTFMDRTGVQGIDMSTYIRKYAHYLNEKRETYKLMGYDFCKVKRGKDDGMLRTMNTEKLLKTLPILQKQLDALVQFDVQPNELTNGVINSCFVLLSKDLIRLFACYNDGVINLLEKFFDMNKKNCKEALDIYKKFLDRTDNVSAFLKVAEASGIDKSDIPDLTKAPSSLLEALEAHVNGIDGTKKVNGTSGTSAYASSSNSNAASSNKQSSNVTNAINSLNNNTVLSPEEKRRVLEEEAKTLEQFKSNHLKKQTSVTSPTKENPFGSATSNGSKSPSAAATPSHSNDLFGLDLTNNNNLRSNLPNSNTNNNNNSNGSASDDLLMLSGPNPFIQNIVNQTYAAQNMSMAGGMGAAPNPFQTNPMMMSQPAFPMNPMFNNSNTNNKILFNSNLMMNNQQIFPPSPSSINNKVSLNSNVSLIDSKPADDLFGSLDFGGSPPLTASPSSTARVESSHNIKASGSETGHCDERLASEHMIVSSHSTDDNINILRPSAFTPTNFNSTISNNGEPFNSSSKAYSGIDFSEFDAFGDVLQPTSTVLNPVAPIIKQQNGGATTPNSSEQKILSTNLDASLASLANNLDINYKNNNFQKNHQWSGSNAQQNQSKTGGQTWKPTGTMTAPVAASSAWNNNPMMMNPIPTTMNQNWTNPNPFAASIQPMVMQPNLLQQQPIRPAAVPSSNNPFDLF